MGRLLNALLGRGYSYDDLLKEGAPFLSNPKLPAGFPEVLSYFDGRKRTYIEVIQLGFKEYLKQIADKRTKAEQRTELLKIRLEELAWHAIERAAKDAKYVQSWEHFIEKGSIWFETYPKTEWKRQLTGRFMGALVMGAWLSGVGRTLYGVEDYIESALELYEHYDTEIKTLNVSMFELIFEKLSNHEDEEGLKISKLHDEVIRPLIDEQYAILDRLAADIKANTIDVDYYKSQFARIDEIKKHIAGAVIASAIPN
jgi:hypothetical protein